MFEEECKKQPVCPSKSTDTTEVFCDFDGTITLVDATDAVLETFALPTWRDWEERWLRGEITSQECLSHQVELIRADYQTLVQFAADLPVDEGFFALHQLCGELHIPLTIVSDGLDLLVETILRRHGLLDITVFSNHLQWNKNGIPSLWFPFASDRCESGAGTCKCALTCPSKWPSTQKIYIGDGHSDRCASVKMTTLFAKGALKTWCQAQGVPHIPFETLTDVAGLLPLHIKGRQMR